MFSRSISRYGVKVFAPARTRTSAQLQLVLEKINNVKKIAITCKSMQSVAQGRIRACEEFLKLARPFCQLSQQMGYIEQDTDSKDQKSLYILITTEKVC